MRAFRTALAVLLAAAPLSAAEAQARPDRFPLVYNPLTSVDAGATATQGLFRLAFRGLDEADDALLGDAPYAAQFALRGLRGVLIDFPLIFQSVLVVHEGVGHTARARDGGGKFRIVRAWPLFPGKEPKVSLSKPAGWTATDDLTEVLGGYEANHAMALAIQKEIYARGESSFDEDLMAAMNKVQVAFGSFVRERANPNDPLTYTNPPEDTAEFAAAYQRARGVPVLVGGAPHPEMVDFYKKTRTASLWALADPIVLESLYHLGWSVATMQRRRAPWTFPLGEARWMYGTTFNLTPLGYEFYLHLFARREGRSANAYLRAGRPMRHNGFGLEVPEVFVWDRLGLGAGVDAWSQAGYGDGGAGHLLAAVRLRDSVYLTGKLGAKSRGYLLAQPVRPGGYGWAGLEARF